MTKTFEEQKSEVKAEQSELSYEEIKELMRKQNDFLTELDNLKPQQHNWTDRGAKLTCENAGHTYHEVWKRKK